MLFSIGKILKYNIANAFNESDEYDTHQMVAVFMVYANKFVAEKISSYDQVNVLLRSQSISKIMSKIDDTNNANDVSKDIIKKYRATQSERAIYKLGTNECDHMQMGLKYYTHFTSPIRRYADILVHRQLWNVITGKSIDDIPCQTLFRMNSFSKIYKHVQRYSRILDFVHDCEENEIISDAFIISIFHMQDSIRIHIPSINIDCDVVIIHKKIKHLFEITDCDDKIIIKSENKTIEMKLFQKITIKIVITKKNLNKLNVIILDPDIKFLLSSNIANIL
jgi:exoribonuclease R